MKYNIEELKLKYPEEKFKNIYLDYSKTKEEIVKELNVSNHTLNLLSNIYNVKRDSRLKFNGRKKEYLEIANKYGREYFEDLFCNQLLSVKEIAKILNVCNDVVNKIILYYNLKRDRGELMSSIISKSNNYGAKFQEALSKISKEDLIKYYIEGDLEYFEAAEYFGITCSMLDKIRNYYGLKKDFSKRMFNELEKKYQEYGSKEAYIKHLVITAKETLASKYGGYEKIPDFLHIKNSKPNMNFKNNLDILNIEYLREFMVEDKFYDFKVENNLIEINPTYTHNSTWNHWNGKGIPYDYHYNKFKLAFNNGYRCIHIFDWDDKEKIIKSLLPKKSIYARKCIVKMVDKKDTDNFLNLYHFQNTCRGQKICLGLYYNDELIQIMTFGMPRYNKKYEYELLRLCTKYDFKIVGGAEKLFKHFVKNFAPKSIISYCDNSKFSGTVYTRLGMKLLRFNKPTKHWYNEKTNTHITHNLLAQRGFDQLLGDRYGNYDKGTSNEELMVAHGFVEIYDCGQSSYIWEKE